MSIITVKQATRQNGALFSQKTRTAASSKLLQIFTIFINVHYQKCEIVNLSLISQLCTDTFNFIDVHDVCVAVLGFRIQNKMLSGYVSRLLLARHLIALRNHPELTRTILGGLGSDEPEKIFASTKRLTNIVLHETPVDEAEYWKDRFLSLLRTSSVPTLEQCVDVGTAYSYLVDPMDSSIPVRDLYFFFFLLFSTSRLSIYVCILVLTVLRNEYDFFNLFQLGTKHARSD